jgi:hypothetical protein
LEQEDHEVVPFTLFAITVQGCSPCPTPWLRHLVKVAQFYLGKCDHHNLHRGIRANHIPAGQLQTKPLAVVTITGLLSGAGVAKRPTGEAKEAGVNTGDIRERQGLEEAAMKQRPLKRTGHKAAARHGRGPDRNQSWGDLQEGEDIKEPQASADTQNGDPRQSGGASGTLRLQVSPQEKRKTCPECR